MAEKNYHSTGAHKPHKNDAVCGMDLTEVEGVLEMAHEGKDFYFCSEACQNRFKDNPIRYQGEPLIKVRDVWKIFKVGDTETKVLRGLDLNIWQGDFVAIIGASGSGKSTSLNMMGLLDTSTSGDIFLKGIDVSTLSDEKKSELRSKTFGFVFQQYNLIPWLSAYDNIVLPIIFSGNAVNKIDIEKIKKDIEKMGLKNREKHRPFELSGGEQQRVALLRALANDPEIILGDEPTGNLDSATGAKILETLIDLNKVQRKTLIVVTHDASIAEKADQVITLKDGKVIKDHFVHRKIYTGK